MEIIIIENTINNNYVGIKMITSGKYKLMKINNLYLSWNYKYKSMILSLSLCNNLKLPVILNVSPDWFLVDYPIENLTPCYPNPCGTNAQCIESNGIGSCRCLSEFFGDPYSGCRPECATNYDCAQNLACIQNKCRNPCPSSCAQNAECFVQNHLPMCACRSGFTGNPYDNCYTKRKHFVKI